MSYLRTRKYLSFIVIPTLIASCSHISSNENIKPQSKTLTFSWDGATAPQEKKEKLLPPKVTYCRDVGIKIDNGNKKRTIHHLRCVFDKHKGVFYSTYRKRKKEIQMPSYKVTLYLKVLPEGKVVDASIINSDPTASVLDKSIVNALSRMYFPDLDVETWSGEYQISFLSS